MQTTQQTITLQHIPETGHVFTVVQNPVTRMWLVLVITDNHSQVAGSYVTEQEALRAVSSEAGFWEYASKADAA